MGWKTNDDGSYMHKRFDRNNNFQVIVTKEPTYGQTVSGYGGKIPTRYKVKVGRKWHRVYVAIYGNSGTTYIRLNKEDVLVDID